MSIPRLTRRHSRKKACSWLPSVRRPTEQRRLEQSLDGTAPAALTRAREARTVRGGMDGRRLSSVLAIAIAAGAGCDDSAERCARGDVLGCEQACQKGRTGDGGCLSVASRLVATEPERAFPAMVRVCEEGSAEDCQAAFRLVSSPRTSREREIGRTLALALCNAPGPKVGDPPFSRVGGYCLRAANDWLLDDPDKSYSAYARGCDAETGERGGVLCKERVAEYAALSKRLAPACREGQARACARHLRERSGAARRPARARGAQGVGRGRRARRLHARPWVHQGRCPHRGGDPARRRPGDARAP